MAVALPPADLPRKLSAVLLDAGGTLLAERTSRAALYAQAGREAGLDVSADEMLPLMYRTHAELPRSLDGHFRYSRGWFEAFIERVFVAGLGLPRPRLPGLREGLFGRFADPATFRALPGARALLDALAERGLRVGVVSNWSEALPGLLAGLGLAERLDFVVVSALVGCEKPERRIFELALARAGARAEEALHAGDDPDRDVQGARAAGILPVLVGPAAAPAGCRRVDDLAALGRTILESLP